MTQFMTAYASVITSSCVLGCWEAQRPKYSTINHVVWRTATSFPNMSPLLLSTISDFVTEIQGWGGGCCDVGGVPDSGTGSRSFGGSSEGAYNLIISGWEHA